MLFFWISLDLDLRSQVISWSLLVPSCSIIFTYKKLTPPTLASGITTMTFSVADIQAGKYPDSVKSRKNQRMRRQWQSLTLTH